MLLDRITIGSSIESLTYAFLNDDYFLPTLPFGPLFYERLEEQPLLGTNTDYSWSRLQTIMSLEGRLLNYENLNFVKIVEDEIKISSKEGLFKYEFNVCNIFDPTGIQVENDIIKQNETLYRVYDDFELGNLGGKHKYLEPKLSKDDLARQIHYYTSDRVDGANYVTDCVAESILTKQQINDVDYSDSTVRFCVLRHLTSIGIHGTFMNMYKSGKPKYRKPKAVHKKRVVIEQEQNIYKDSITVKFPRLSLKEILDGARP